MRCKHVSRQIGFSRERCVARVTFVRLVRGVGLQMASQCLLVLNYTLHTGAWVGIGVVAIVEPPMEDEMVFPREKFWAVGAIVFVIVLVNPPVPSQAVALL